MSTMQLLNSNFALPSNSCSLALCRGVDSLSGSMKSTHHFRDQLSVISGWFEQWNECEQTVALYSLVQKIAPLHARFLSFVLEQSLTQRLAELNHQEQQANDPAYISCLSNESKEVAVTQLLSHLPLLRPGNEEAKAQYLSLIPKILAHSVRHSVHIEESRQLLSYSLIHPAISNDDRSSLTLWLRQLEDRIHNNYPVFPPPPSPYVNGISPANGDAFSNNASRYGATVGSQMDMWRTGPLLGLNNGNLAVDVNGYSVMNGLGSNSLPPGVGNHHVAVHPMNSAPSSTASSRPDGMHTLPLAHSRVRRSSSLTPPGNAVSRPLSTSDWKFDHAPLSPQSSAASSGSESQKDVFSQEGSGMRDVPSWLKSLRLHKYSYIFKNMDYDEMMSLTEVKLEKMNITKGARHKIVLSIQKLRDRQSCMQALEKDIQDGTATVKSVLNELKSVLQTPIKCFVSGNAHDSNFESSSQSDSSGSDPPSPPRTPIMMDNDVVTSALVSEGDIPGQIARLMGRICSALLITPHHEEENHNYFIMLIDKCLSHEAFSPLQKRRLFSWKQQIQKISHPLPPRRSLDTRQNKGKWSSFPPQNTDFGSSIRRRLPVHYQQSAHRMQLPRPGCVSAQANVRGSLASVIKRPSLQDHTKPHVNIQRTNSAPVRPNPLPPSVFDSKIIQDAANDPEINIRLESLCLSVTEHALGDLDGAVPSF